MIRLAILTTAFALLTQPVFAQKVPKGYKLVWADEFNKPGKPDPKNWNYETGFVRNNELQWYQPQNAVVKNGLLIIEARRERKPNPNYNPAASGNDAYKTKREAADYTSACLITSGKHSWTYGRFEMRAKIDVRPGIWPAFWALGTEKEWPAGGEIDIMEAYGGNLLANFFWASDQRWKPIVKDSRIPVTSFDDPKWSEKFHIWRMDWDKTKISLFMDNRLMNEIEIAKTINQDGSNQSPYHSPLYLLLNLAIGGDAGGDPSKTTFPAKLEVDYVRVYQK